MPRCGAGEEGIGKAPRICSTQTTRTARVDERRCRGAEGGWCRDCALRLLACFSRPSLAARAGGGGRGGAAAGRRVPSRRLSRVLSLGMACDLVNNKSLQIMFPPDCDFKS